MQEFKGYVFKIMGGQDKQGFPMKQGVLTNGRVQVRGRKGAGARGCCRLVPLPLPQLLHSGCCCCCCFSLSHLGGLCGCICMLPSCTG